MAEPAARERALPSREARPRVIYVMGAGRSGSTILGVTLGNCQGVFYAGELDAWLSRAGAPQVNDAERARFWDAVREEVPGAEELFGWEAQRAIERSVSLFRIHKWRARRRLRGPYRRVAADLYRAVGRAAGTSLIVDTSHYPLRARELQALTDVDLYLLYLVRDPQSVVASFNRRDVAQYNKSTLTTNVYLWLTNLLSVWVFRRHPEDRRMFMRYEDFIADPARALRDILARVGVSSRPPDFTSLDSGLAFQGNRLIRSEGIVLEAGPGGAPARSRLTALLQGPWMAMLGRLRPVVRVPGGE